MTSIPRKINNNPDVYPILVGALFLAVLVGLFPIQLSILIVFLFAGPHNFIEFRYLLSRLPARYSKIRSFFLLGGIGVILLSGSYLALALLAKNPMWQAGAETMSSSAYRLWNCALIIWVVALIYLRSREEPKKDWGLAYPVAALLLAFNWLVPQMFSVSIAYLHPLVAFWILYGEIKRLRPAWLKRYEALLLALPFLLILFWLVLYSKPDLAIWDSLTQQIVQHAGSMVIYDVSTHVLVATHSFLELLHYAVWLVAVPLVTGISRPFKLEKIPLMVRWKGAGTTVRFVLLGGAALVAALYVCFGLNFETTRYIYFSFAIIHVIAEIPLLLRLI